MIKFCPSCGRELKNEFKFCPSCGYNLKNVKEDIHPVGVVEIIECDNCGTENSTESSVCKSCGINLKSESKTFKKQPSTKHFSSKKEELTGQTKNETKEIDSKKILIIFSIILIGGFIILLAAGVFDNPAPSGITNTQTMNQGQSSGIDLSAINKINELEEKLKINPNDNQILLELAHLRNDSGMFEKAIENYQEYLKRVSNDADARIDMGVCYYNLGRYDEAIIAMNKALEYSPNHQIGHLNLGIVNLASGNIEKSREWLQKAVALGPETEVGKRAQELLISH